MKKIKIYGGMELLYLYYRKNDIKINLIMIYMKIYTKKGDQGNTSLANGEVYMKSEIYFQILGDLDELNSALGLISGYPKIQDIQMWIFDISCIIGNPDSKYIFDNDKTTLAILESEIDKMTEELPKLRNFIIPSGHIHLARAISRRCERSYDKFFHGTNEKRYLIIYQFLNRLSDYLFTLARYDNQLNKKNKEVIYQKTDMLTIVEPEKKQSWFNII